MKKEEQAALLVLLCSEWQMVLNKLDIKYREYDGKEEAYKGNISRWYGDMLIKQNRNNAFCFKKNRRR